MDLSNDEIGALFEESGSEYLPSDKSEDSPDSESSEDAENNRSLINTIDVIQNPVASTSATYSDSENEPQGKTRKRQRNPSKWKKNIRKALRVSGKEYKNVKGISVPAKKFSAFDCICKKACHTLVDIEHQETIFNDFYNLSNHDLQTSYIHGRIRVVGKKRKYTKQTESHRMKTRIFTFPDKSGVEVTVCKYFFKTLLNISDGRITRALKRDANSTPPVDQRGRHEPFNKTSGSVIKEVSNFISKFPTYISHYSRNKSGDRRYLAPDLNISIMYTLYCTDRKENDMPPVSQYVFRSIFNTKFNYHFHPPIKDSCKRCDSFKVKIIAAEGNEKASLQSSLELHQRKAELARSEMTKDAEIAKTGALTTIAFDLMKTLPTPVLSTGICYYKRQLWTYVLGIHDLGTNTATMYTWDESKASRGSQEIGSCLLHYIKENVVTEHLVMYSDQCGGQNRNIKMVSFMNYLCNNPDFIVNKVDHKFLVSGHSFLPCDQDFGLIEKAKKYQPNIFVPSDWLSVIENARKRNPFKIKVMEKTDFFSSTELESKITNRKIDVKKEKVQWLLMQWIRTTSLKPYTLLYKYTNSADTEFNEVNYAKRQINQNAFPDKLTLLFPTGRAIEKAKCKDLKELLQFVPPVHHAFYQNLQESHHVVEDANYIDTDSD